MHPDLNLSKSLSLWSFKVLSVPICASSEYSAFLSHSQEPHMIGYNWYFISIIMMGVMIYDSQSMVGLTVSVHGCLSLCGPVMIWLTCSAAAYLVLMAKLIASH